MIGYDFLKNFIRYIQQTCTAVIFTEALIFFKYILYPSKLSRELHLTFSSICLEITKICVLNESVVYLNSSSFRPSTRTAFQFFGFLHCLNESFPLYYILTLSRLSFIFLVPLLQVKPVVL